MKISKDKAREQILDMVGDLFHATVAEMTMPRIYDGRTLEEAKSAVNAAFDSIEDHPKVVLPQEVGEWVGECRDDGDAKSMLDYEWVPDAVEAWCDDGDSDGIESYYAEQLMQAYLYGWTPAPEPKWYVQTPKEWWMSKEVPEYAGFNRFQGMTTGAGSKNEVHPFTRAELKQYHLDSDIFTLVPVEDEK